MQENKERYDNNNNSNNNDTQNQMAQNPNPRANENIQNTSFEKTDSSDNQPDVGSEITDGGAG